MHDTPRTRRLLVRMTAPKYRSYNNIQYMYITTDFFRHSQACQDRRADFVPFVVTTDGCIGNQGQKFLKRLGKRLAEKWGKAYSEAAGLLFSRMFISIVRAVTMCIRATRNPVQCHRWCMDDGAALDLMLE